MMAGIRGRNTKPEMFVRSCLHRAGFRFRLHVKDMPGRPDVVLPRFEAAIFVHGCFWHRHAGCPLATTPASNVDKWKTKFRENVKRDRRNVESLREAGTRVAIIWECGLRKATCADIHELYEWLRSAEDFFEWPVFPASQVQ